MKPFRRFGVAALAAAAMLVACGDDPAGPEELSLEMVAPVAVGGALLELSGENILEVRGPAGVEITTLPIRAEGEKALPRLRVLAILETPGPLNLTVVVAEAGAPVPGATLLQASGPDDALLLSSRLPAIRVVR